MSDKPKAITVYRGRRGQVAGLKLTSAAGGFTVPADALSGIVPAAGDSLTGPDGVRHRVTAAALAGGTYTLTCEPEGGAP